jgi:DNA-directed RNA polymerase subunit omega
MVREDGNEGVNQAASGGNRRIWRAEFAVDEWTLGPSLSRFSKRYLSAMRDDYIKEALKSIQDPNVLINVVSRRVKQLKRGNRPLVESLEKLSPEDVALREVIEGKISHELASV